MQVWKLVCSVALVLWMSGAHAAGSVTNADLAAIRQVIERQIDAFRRDDAQGAFALVSPDVRHSFGTAERFLEVVRMAYRAVYRPANVAFLDLTVMSGEVVQQLQVTDRAGGLWLAYFSMQRQADGSWRMNGCHLVQPARTLSA
jgi:ketosteroid isomerase-like protein